MSLGAPNDRHEDEPTSPRMRNGDPGLPFFTDATLGILQPANNGDNQETKSNDVVVN